MTKNAILKLDTRSNKWVATYNGQLVMKSMSKQHIIKTISNGLCNKANAIGVTGVMEDGVSAVVENSAANTPAVADERFSINERFDFLTDLVTMVADRTSPSLVVTGEGGLGKSFTVNKALRDSNMKNSADMIGYASEDYVSEDESKKLFSVVKGYSTAKGLYRTLYENRNRIVLFDDCDSILRDPVALNILKGALDSYDRRIISWNAESSFGGDDDLPRSFEFKGGIIFISNLPLYKVDQAIRSRSLCVDLSMNSVQKIERMGAIIKSDEFLPDYGMDTKKAALAFIDKFKDRAGELSLRTLISVTKVAGRGNKDWEKLAEYVMTAA